MSIAKLSSLEQSLFSRVAHLHCSDSDAGPGLEQSRDAEETVTTENRDSKGNAGNAGVTRANLLWNNQHAPLACEDD